MSEFPKHYNHKEVEVKLQQFWHEQGIYRFDSNDNKRPIFSVDTPPPYVSADHLHVGHAMSYSQAEFVVRYQRMQGKNIFYPMGFDDNGLPTERFVEKKYKINKNKTNRKEFVDLCLQETEKGAQTYKDLWKALAISVDWQLTYSTINPHCQKTAQKSFIELYEHGHIQRKNEPIIWCYHCQTSLAQADVDTVEKDSHLHDIAFKDPNGKDLVISTTRPELIPACVALYVNPNDARYKDIVGQEAIVPLIEHRVPIKTDESVDLEYGTGLMMVCTWGDMEDVRKWKEHGLETRMIFDQKGMLNQLCGEFEGIYYTKARKAIIEKLKETGAHLKSEPLKHNVGVHDRCGTPIDFNMAPQWFINTLSIKDALIKRGNEIKWHPEFMKVRYEQWVKDLKWDWNISRQRFYGVPFPVWYHKETDEVILADEDKLPVDPMVDQPNEKCSHDYGNDELRPESDVMDTWMTSSLTPLIASQWANWHEAEGKALKSKVYPMTVRPQAFEIIRTWLFYTVLKSHYHTDSVPWDTVMISGWGLDSKGRKISKSLGNFVDAHKVIGQYSADALRYWAAGSTLGHDLRYNEKDVASGRKIVVKLWNAFKFVSSNLDLKNLETDLEKAKKPLIVIDRWALSKLQETIQKATENFEIYEYSHALKATERFFWLTYCDNYLEIVKDRFWNPDDYKKEDVFSAHQTLYLLSVNLLKLFAPFLPFITEELWQRCFKEKEGDQSIHTAAWPKANDALVDTSALEDGELLLSCLIPIRKYKSLHKIHQNHRLKEVTLYAKEEKLARLKNIQADLASACRAEQLNIKEGKAKEEKDNIVCTEDESILIEIN